MEKKKLTLVVVSLLVVFSIVISYIALNTKEKRNTNENVKIKFVSNTKIASTDIKPGWTSTKTFKVKNDSKSESKIDIMIQDLINTFVTINSLQYKVTSDNNGYNMTEFKDVPKSDSATDTVLAYSVSVPAGVTQTYRIEFKYENDESVYQSYDKGKSLSGTLFITENTGKTLSSKLIEDKTERKTRTDFSTIFYTDNTKTLYTGSENSTTVYYFAGNALDNWVKFGKNSNGEDLYWRIIRTNSDGSIRLLYHSTSPSAEDAYISTSAFNDSYDDGEYVGYMFNSNGTDSTIKNIVDTWYAQNLHINYGKYLSTTAVYCNDRLTTDGTHFGTYNRLINNKTPKYDCSNDSDAFSASNSSAKLIYPIGLMTADEVSFAGGLWDDYAQAYYYENSTGNSSTSDTWWYTMSPCFWNGSISFEFVVGGSYMIGYLGNIFVDSIGGVRPVISLKSCVKYSSGDGSATNPYTIDESYSC